MRGLPMDETDIDVTGTGEMLMSKIDISEHDLRGKDLYLYRCNDCGTQHLLGAEGGEIPCGCASVSGVTVTVLNQQSPEEREAEAKARMDAYSLKTFGKVAYKWL